MIKIRPATQSDIDAIYALASDVAEFRVNDGTVNFWPKDVLASVIAATDVYVMVAAEGDVVNGFVVANCNKSLKKVLVENIYVKPETRGNNIGANMLSILIDTAMHDGYEYIATLVPLAADDAANMYEAAGFTKGESFMWLDKPLGEHFAA